MAKTAQETSISSSIPGTSELAIRGQHNEIFKNTGLISS
jgi:hypothetical protein